MPRILWRVVGVEVKYFTQSDWKPELPTMKESTQSLYEQIFFLGRPTPNLDHYCTLLMCLFAGEPICSRLPDDQARYLDYMNARTPEEIRNEILVKINPVGITITLSDFPYTNFMRGGVVQEIIWHPGIENPSGELLIEAFREKYPDDRPALFFTNGYLKSINDKDLAHSHVIHEI